jgi:hypothetical protein
MGCSRRTSMRLCVLLRSARSIIIGNQYSKTIRTILFSPPLSAPPPECTASFCVFFFYRPTGRPRRTSMPLECQRNNTTRTRSGFAGRPSLPESEEQSQTRGGQGGGVEDQPQCRGLWRSRTANARPLLRSVLPFFSPSLCHSISLSPALTSA